MTDLRKIENWEFFGLNEFGTSLKQIFQPFNRDDDRYCGHKWYFVIKSFNNRTWFLNIDLRDVRDGVTYGEDMPLLSEEFRSYSYGLNRKAAMRKAYNIAKAMELV